MYTTLGSINASIFDVYTSQVLRENGDKRAIKDIREKNRVVR